MNSFDILYKNELGEVVSKDIIVRVKRKQLNSLILLQEDLIYSFYKNNASIGSIIADNSNWNTMIKISNLLNVVGKEKTGINLEKLEDDILQLTRIFFTQSINDNGEIDNLENDIFKPSLISQLHQLDYFGSSKKAIQRMMQENKEVQ